MAPPSASPPSESRDPDGLARGRELLADGKVEEARAVYSAILADNPRDMKAREGIAACATAAGHAELRAGNIDKAVSHYQKALEIVPFHPGADDGLRRAAALAKEREAQSADPLLSAIDRLPPMQALREARAAERVIAKATGLPTPSTVVKQKLDQRHADLAASGAPPREKRVSHERERAWARRWFYRTLPIMCLAASGLLVVATGHISLAMWGVLFAVFAVAWDLMFVERHGSG